MEYGELIDFLQNVGKDPSRLVFEDELTGLHNRRFLLSYFAHKVDWNSEESFPLSIAIADVDLFKTINDTYGHDAGDEALVWVARLLEEVAGEDGFAIRQGGDEFAMLLPGTPLETAREKADRLNELTKLRPLRLENGRGELRLSLSIGVAAARVDAATSAELMRRADTALYTAKKLGRNRVATAAEIDPQKTFAKTALYRLDDAQVAGRSVELRAVSDALNRLTTTGSQFVLIEGASGMGKTTMLDSVRRSLAQNDTVHAVQVSGRRQEGYRPYYLIGQVLVSLLTRRGDKGISVIDELDPKQAQSLGQILPHLQHGLEQVDEDDAERRESIFYTAVELVSKLRGERALVLLLDDLQFADEASLMVIRRLFENRDDPILVCGAVAKDLTSPGVEPGEKEPPWPRFVARHDSDLSVEAVELRPLAALAISDHLSSLFPGIQLPERFEDELADITQGNPLFLNEILRKLVLDQKLTLTGQEWSVESPEEGYLPRSIEEIVDSKIAALDAEGRKVLEQVSTLGESTSLTMLTGSTDTSEAKVLEFLDRAETLGLLRTDFHINDETMRFLGKRVLEIAYGSIDASRREELHERVASYQEELYLKQLGPSASILAYHFKRSANRDKASRYDTIHAALSRKAFNSKEAENYSDSALQEDEIPRDDKLNREALAQLPNLFRTLLTAVRSVQLYPAGSKPIDNAYRACFDAIDAILAHAERVHLSRSRDVLLVTGNEVDTTEFRLLARSYLGLLGRAELEGIEFRRGLPESELKTMLSHLGHLKPDTLTTCYWEGFSSENQLEFIQLRQMRYSEVQPGGAKLASAEETGLDAEALAELPGLLRAFMGAAKNIKLYPMGSRPVAVSIDHLSHTMASIVTGQNAITLARTAKSLLVNGERVNTAGFESLAESFLDFMARSELTSVTLLPNVLRGEVETYVAALKELPPDVEPGFWQEFTAKHHLEGMALNDRRYTVNVAQSVVASVSEDAPVEPDPDEAREDEPSDGPMEALCEELPSTGRDFLIKGEHQQLHRLLDRLFTDYGEHEPPVRQKIIRSMSALLESLTEALRYQVASLSADFVLDALRQEDDPQVLGELSELLHGMTGPLLRFTNHILASRIFSELNQKRLDLTSSPSGTSRELAKLMTRSLDGPTRELLIEDVRSGEPERQTGAAQVLESLGKPSISMLIEIIKQEKDFRIRQLAAGLLAKMGRAAAKRLKREVVLEVTSEQRFRILEVIDVVTQDVRTELAFCLSDINPKVRRAAFRLSERLNDKQGLELLVDFARHEDIGVAKGAIRSLANLRSPHAVGALISTLQVTKDAERAIACAQALAQLGDPVAVSALAKVLIARRFALFGGKKWDDQVRATAAFALAQIGGEAAKAALDGVKDDGDPRIRQIALSGVNERAPQGDDEEDEFDEEHPGDARSESSKPVAGGEDVA